MMPAVAPCEPIHRTPMMTTNNDNRDDRDPVDEQQQRHEPIVPPAAETQQEEGGAITITDQDVLFGRGGLTNRHIGNLRYRDIISIHRQDYVRSPKTEKPNVARRIVKAIRTGKNPGRFLKKGDDGNWIAVSDKEATWKASQALREKSRWSSMKQDNGGGGKRGNIAEGTVVDVVAARESSSSAKDPSNKRAAAEEEEEVDGSLPAGKRTRVDCPLPAIVATREPAPHLRTAEHVPTHVSDISVPPVFPTLGGGASAERVGGPDNRAPPPPPPPNPNHANNMDLDGNLFPRDEDVLFGRGGRTNHHPGNKRLREIVDKYRDTYHRAKKVDKPKVSKLIVGALRSARPPSRFLRMNEATTRWEDVGDKRAAEKVSQTLREKERGGVGGGGKWFSQAVKAAAQTRKVADAEVFAAVAQAAHLAAGTNPATTTDPTARATADFRDAAHSWVAREAQVAAAAEAKGAAILAAPETTETTETTTDPTARVTVDFRDADHPLFAREAPSAAAAEAERTAAAAAAAEAKRVAHHAAEEAKRAARLAAEAKPKVEPTSRGTATVVHRPAGGSTQTLPEEGARTGSRAEEDATRSSEDVPLASPEGLVRLPSPEGVDV